MLTLTRPNPTSGVPVYLQLMEQVARAVETGALRPGDPLPAVRGLAEELVIHPNAVARAYQALADEGVLTRPDGTGAVLTSGRRLTTKPFPGAGAGRAAEQAARALIDRELRGAREVQDRLLPQDYPAVDGIDYAGVSRPALGVGGDYFDFIRVSERAFGIAIGDVCGKGMPAALLMATLRASLRALRNDTLGPDGIGDLAAMVARLNRLVYDSSTPNRFASFFYAQYDPSTRLLRYVNAGHNPPVVLRNGTALRLACSGPVIGLMCDSLFTEERVVLERGDVLVAFTDGITEAVSGDRGDPGDPWDDVEFGEDRLLQAIVPALAARDLVALVMSQVDTFVAGGPQRDDMTAVAVRIF